MNCLHVRQRATKDKHGRARELVEFSFRTKDAKYGEVLHEEYIGKRTRFVLIVGAHASGKTRYLEKMRSHAQFWAQQQRPYSCKTKPALMNNPERDVGKVSLLESDWQPPDPVFLGGINSLSSWVDIPGLADWWGERGYALCDEDVPWSRLAVHKKQDALPVYLQDTKAVLFIDDLDKCAGKKKEIAKLCIRSAFRCVLSAKSENAIDPTIRTEVLRTTPQLIELETDAAYDATAVMVYTLIVFCVMAGLYEMAMILVGLKLFASGKGGLQHGIAKQT